MPNTRRSMILPALCLALAACSGEQQAPAPAASEAPATPAPTAPSPQPAAPEPEPVAAPAPLTNTQQLMRGHFQQATEAREALIRGDIEAAKKAMTWLTEHHDDAAVPAELRPMLGQMQTAAAAFGKATTLRECGAALAATLTQCGTCHRTAGKGPQIALTPLPEGTDPKAQMQRHLWAAHRMWEGLVVGSTELYVAGAKALSEATVRAADLQPGERAAQADKLIEHLHDLAAKAQSASTDGERAEIYGHFVASCATCHRLFGKGGPQP